MAKIKGVCHNYYGCDKAAEKILTVKDAIDYLSKNA